MTNKIKVLYFTDNYNIDGGGAEKIFFQQIKDFKNDKNIEIYSAGFGQFERKEKKVRIFKETNNSLLKHIYRLFFHPLMYLKLKKHFNIIKPDIIHLHNINKYTLSLIKACSGFKVVMTVHDYKLVCPTQTNVHKDLKICKKGFNNKCIFEHRHNYNIFTYLSLLYLFYNRNKALKKKVSKFISPSPQLKEYLQKQGFKNVVFIPNKISTNKNYKKNEKNKHLDILYVGMLEKNKGVDILIKYFQRFIKINNQKNLRLLIAGTGSYEDKIRNYIQKKKCKNVILLGWVNPEKYYKSSKILVLPNIFFENLPTVILEAMSVGLPVLASDRGGANYLIDNNDNGFLFNILDFNSFNEKLKILLNNKKIYQKIIKKSKIKFNQIKKSVDLNTEIIEIYKSIL